MLAVFDHAICGRYVWIAGLDGILVLILRSIIVREIMGFENWMAAGFFGIAYAVS